MSSRRAMQISAQISEGTHRKLARFVRGRGMRRGRVIEDALLHHLRALDEIPDEFVIPARLVLSAEGAKRLEALLASPPAPTPTMKRLMKGEDIGDPP